MALTKKATILFEPDLYRNLELLARDRKSSVGELVRSACRSQYGLAARGDRLAAVAALAQFSLPVGSVDDMKCESVPGVEFLH